MDQTKQIRPVSASSVSGYSPWFLAIVAVFVTCLITANILAVKPFIAFDQVLTAGVIIFPISYIFGDVLTEVYGYRQARRVIWLAFLCNLLAVVAFAIGQAIPPAGFWTGQSAYEAILGQTPRILFASFVAYLVGEFANSFVLAKLKIATRGRWLWTRTISSTVIGEGLDSAVFVTLAFAGVAGWSAATIMSAVVAQWVVKSLYEILATPLTYLVVGFLKRKEGVDVYDYDTNFNPLLVAE